MKEVKLIKGGTYTAFGKTVKNGESEKFKNEQADYLIESGHFELVGEIKKTSSNRGSNKTVEKE